ncbi:hypothetical protein Pelo_361 [Pelomyxa schiedti]|nr:hypothetical protein Pelo_361 [Pelomyxa schiedti]
MKRGFVLFAVGVACVACVMTPFGDMPEECVHQAGENEIIHPVAGGVELRDEAGKLLRFVEEKPSCVAAAKEITARHIARRNATNKLQYDGWLDNVGYTTSPKNVGHFESSYTICPTNPTATGQYLYYFIGAENIDNGELSILQPVLAWAVNQWTFCSWNCCPSGQTWQGSTISGLQPGGTYFGKLDVSGGTCAITSQALGQTSLLKYTMPQPARTLPLEHLPSALTV